MPNVLQVNPPSGGNILAWSSKAATGVNSVLLWNTDINNVAYVGQTISITAGNPNTIPVPPNGSISVDPSSNWYVAGSAVGQAPLVVVPNGQNLFLGLTQGQGKLVIPQIQSPNFVHNSAGWKIAKDGSAEFNNLEVRGTFLGTDYIINADGAFFYNGTPANDSLWVSITSVAGTDQFGNAFNQGISSYDLETPVLTIVGGQLEFINAAVQWTMQFNGNNLQLVCNSVRAFQLFQAYLQLGSVGTPVSVNNQALLYSDAIGNPHSVDGGDGNNYAIERITDFITPVTGNVPIAASPGTTIFTRNVGPNVRSYRLSGIIYVAASVANQQLSVGIGVPGGGAAAGLLAVSIQRAAVLVATTEIGVNTLTAIGATGSLVAGNEYVVYIDGIITVGNVTGGNLNVTLATTNTGDLTANTFSYIDLMPQQ